MLRYITLAVLILFPFANLSNAGTITGGQLTASQLSDPAYNHHFLLQGVNFSIAFDVVTGGKLPTLAVPYGEGPGPFNYTNSVNVQLPSALNTGTYSVTYNGVTYSSTAGYGLNLNLNIASSAVLGTQPDILYVFNHAWLYPAASFTLTGSFQVTNSGGSVLVSDTLTGSGTATGSGQGLSPSGTVTYSFAATDPVPEPASLGLTAAAAGLLLFTRRRK